VTQPSDTATLADAAPAPHAYWQRLDPPGSHPAPAGGWRHSYPARLPDGRELLLPLRVLPGPGDRAVSSLIVNQASFAVEDALADSMADHARALGAEVIVGVPTLGLPLANGVARRLGHPRMIALGTSRKFWYRDDLAQPLASITTPSGSGAGKHIYVDPRMLPLLEGRRVVIVDDVASTGSSLVAVVKLLGLAGIAPVGIVVAMRQTRRWHDALRPWFADPDAAVRGVFDTPLFAADGDGWRPIL
jgi:adenine/guanine phosphoribosyltransferase-like PRPP-binding protein